MYVYVQKFPNVPPFVALKYKSHYYIFVVFPFGIKGLTYLKSYLTPPPFTIALF